MFPCRSLNFLKRLFWILCLTFHKSPFFVESVIGALLVSFGCVTLKWFLVIFDSLHIDVIGLFQTLQVCFGGDSSLPVSFSLRFWVCLLVISLGWWGLLLCSNFRWGYCSSSEVEDRRVCHQLRTQWGRTLALFLIQVMLEDGLCNCLCSLVRLTRW